MRTFLEQQLGIATLPTILALTIFIITLVIGMSAWALSENFATASQQQSLQAYLYADAGVNDALTRIVRNASYNCPSTDCYSIDMIDGAEDGCTTFSGCAYVSVSAADGSVGNPKIIVSKGRVKNNYRRLQVDVSISTDGEITNLSWQELNN